MLESNFTCIKNGTENIRLLFQCHNLNMSYPLYGPYKYSFLGVALLDFTLSPIAAIMNAFVILAIARNKSLRTIQNTIISSMALSDMITGVLTQPIKGKVIMNIYHCNPNCPLHITALQISYSLGIVSFLSLSLITLERYIAIFHPYKYELLNKSLFIKIIVGIWVLAATITGLSFLTPQMVLQRLFAIAVTVLSLLFSIPAHIRIARFAKTVQRQISDQRKAVGAENDKDRRFTRSNHSMSKATRVALCILVAMVLCYLPSGLFTILRFFGSTSDFVKAIHDYTQSFVLLNSSINPFLYCMQMRDIRKKIFRFFHICRKTARTGDGYSEEPQAQRRSRVHGFTTGNRTKTIPGM